MNKPAVIRADFADFRQVKSRKVAQLVMEIPLEQLPQAMATLGWPQPDSSRPVAIARLVENAASTLTARDAATARDGLRKEWTRGQKCAYQCSFPTFIEWLGCETEAEAEEVIRTRLKIRSRSELNSNDTAWNEWEKIQASFEIGEPYEA